MSEEGLGALDIEVGDYDEVEAEVNKLLDPGDYQVRVADVPESRFGQASGKQYLAWRVVTVGAEDPENNNYSLFFNTPLEGKGRGIFFSFITALGMRWEGSRITSEFIEGLVGLECIAEVGIRTYEGRESNEVKRTKPIEP